METDRIGPPSLAMALLNSFRAIRATNKPLYCYATKRHAYVDEQVFRFNARGVPLQRS
jgi:hypothetical protein